MKLNPIENYFDDLFYLRNFVTIVLEGFGYYDGVAERVTETIRRISTSEGGTPHPLSEDSYYEKVKDHQRRLANFAKQQREHGYSYLYSLAIVKLWSIVEACTDDIIIILLKDRDRLTGIEAIRKLKCPIIEFISASENEQIEIILEQLKQDIGATLKVGVGRFESMFKVLGFGGTVEDLPRRGILDFSEIRNAIVHNKSLADKRVMARCPWRKLKLGDPINATLEDFNMYFDMCVWYFLELDGRWDRIFFRRQADFPTTKKTSDFKEEVLNDIRSKWELKLT
jgi:hypothetical protein